MIAKWLFRIVQKRNLKDLLPNLSGVPVDNFNDTMTNFVYISDKLKEFYPRIYARLTKLFNEMDIEWGEIEGTKDIWIRDYMPIQISDILEKIISRIHMP